MERLNEINLIGISKTLDHRGITTETDLVTLLERITNSADPHVTYHVYRKYEGETECFIGKKVVSFENLPEGLNTYTILAQNYEVFRDVKDAVETWHFIDNKQDLHRSYIDFELYNEADNTSNIYVGLNS